MRYLLISMRQNNCLSSLGNAFLLVRIASFVTGILYRKQSGWNCPACHEDVSKEFCFVKYNEVLFEETLPTDRLDYCRSFRRLRWHRSPGETRRFRFTPEFSAHFSRTYGCAHIARADIALPRILKRTITTRELGSAKKGIRRGNISPLLCLWIFQTYGRWVWHLWVS